MRYIYEYNGGEYEGRVQWINTEWMDTWEKMAKENKPSINIGYWYWDNVEMTWKCKKRKTKREITALNVNL